MSTPTFSVDGALPARITGIVLVAVPRSGMVTLLGFSKYEPPGEVVGDGVGVGVGVGVGDGPGPPVPVTWSSRFGEPAPGLVTLPTTAAFTRAARTCCGVAFGLPER